MRKLWKIFLLAGVLCAILCVGTLAAEASTSGVYDVKTSTGYTLTPQTAGKSDISASSVTINNAAKQFYANAERFTLTGPSTDGNQYLVLALSGDSDVPTQDNIVYIDQTGATSTTVTFNVYPSALTSGATYNVYMVGTGAGENYKKVASFTYYAPYKLGDVNGDGAVTVSDALLVLNHVAENITLTKNYEIANGVYYDAYDAANVVQDNSLTISDAVKILNYVAENITSFD